MKIALFLSSLAFVFPSLGSAIELQAERECRDDLWQGRVGSLVSLDVRHVRVGQSALTGVLERAENDLLDFGGFLVKAERVVEASVVVPNKGDLIVMNVVGDRGHISGIVTLFDRAEQGLLYGKDLSVPIAALAGRLTVIQPGALVYVGFRDMDGASRLRYKSGFTTFRGRDGSILHFDGGSLPLESITKLQVTQP